MRSTVLEVLHDGIEARATLTGGDGNGVHVELDGQNTTLIALAHLIGDIEDEGGVHTVVELHVDIYIMMIFQTGFMMKCLLKIA